MYDYLLGGGHNFNEPVAVSLLLPTPQWRRDSAREAERGTSDDPLFAGVGIKL